MSNHALITLTDALRQRRSQLGTRWRRLTVGRQALLVLAHQRKGETYADLATGFGIGTPTAFRYIHEALEVLAALAPSLHDAVAVATSKAFVMIDGGARLGTPADIAALARTTNTWRSTQVRRYGRTDTVQITERVCLWYGSFRSRAVRTRRAVERTVPFGLICFSIVTLWYALHGHCVDDVAGHRARARWYTTKTEPSYDDMAVNLRRVIIAARFRCPCPEQATPQET
jgi:Helix-turn-helix of DDE superfamily endonuclease